MAHRDRLTLSRSERNTLIFNGFFPVAPLHSVGVNWFWCWLLFKRPADWSGAERSAVHKPKENQRFTLLLYAIKTYCNIKINKCNDRRLLVKTYACWTGNKSTGAIFSMQYFSRLFIYFTLVDAHSMRCNAQFCVCLSICLFAFNIQCLSLLHHFFFGVGFFLLCFSLV